MSDADTIDESAVDEVDRIFNDERASNIFDEGYPEGSDGLITVDVEDEQLRQGVIAKIAGLGYSPEAAEMYVDQCIEFLPTDD